MTPCTPEETWIHYLHGAPEWVPEKKLTVVVSPHPDDETLAAGGLIATQRGCEVPVMLLAVTDGEAAYPDVPGLGRLRRAEQIQAADALGLTSDRVVHLGMPDSAVGNSECLLADRIEACITSETILVAPWSRDPHPDHEACGRAAAEAASRTGATLISYFFWTWHWFAVDALQGLPLRRLTLSSDARSRRAKALACHRSQLQREQGEPVLPEILLAPARRSFETFLIDRD